MPKKARIIKAQEMPEGQGAKVKRAFPTENISHIDPFVLFDEFFVEPPAGFPEHSHHGFEAITFMLEGAFEHKDNSGASGRIEKGEVQHMVTGGGIRHAEMPGSEKNNHGLQLWINLPENLKKIEPSYKKAERESLEIQKNEHKVVETLVGEGSPIDPHTPVEYLYISLNPQTEFTWKNPKNYNYFIYTVSGEGTINGEIPFADGHLIVPETDKLKIESISELDFALVTGKPHMESI